MTFKIEMRRFLVKFNSQSFVDNVLDMLFKYLDVFAQYLGPIMVFMVIILIIWIVAVFYYYFISEMFITYSPIHTFLSLLYGHYLLIMIIYYYYKAWKTSPGNSGKLGVMPNFKNCKKCLNVKPERAHHCSLCKTCILKMDHHCPWLNTCIGHWNHRFFYLFMMFTATGCSYVFYIVFPYFNQYIILDSPLFGKYIPNFFNSTHSFHQPHLDDLLKLKFKESEITGVLLRNSDLMRNILVIQFVLPFAVTFSLTLLLLWHSYLISCGETSIEYHINRSAKAELYKTTNGQAKFLNPYDYGFLTNWLIFFGLNSMRDVVWNILLPDLRSTSKSAIGDGWQWNKAYMLRELRISHHSKPVNLNLCARLVIVYKTFLPTPKQNKSSAFNYQALKLV